MTFSRYDVPLILVLRNVRNCEIVRQVIKLNLYVYVTTVEVADGIACVNLSSLPPHPLCLGGIPPHPQPNSFPSLPLPAIPFLSLFSFPTAPFSSPVYHSVHSAMHFFLGVESRVLFLQIFYQFLIFVVCMYLFWFTF